MVPLEYLIILVPNLILILNKEGILDKSAARHRNPQFLRNGFCNFLADH